MARYFAFLSASGYQLAEVEQLVLARPARRSRCSSRFASVADPAGSAEPDTATDTVSDNAADLEPPMSATFNEVEVAADAS